MVGNQHKLSHVSEGLAEVLARLEAARETLQPLLDGQDGDLAPVRHAVARLERMEAEVARIEAVCAGQAIGSRVVGQVTRPSG